MEVLDWNGQDLPEELRPVNTTDPLTPAQDAGLQRGLRELSEGQSVPRDEVVARWRDRLGG